jgi:hypothetical protein
MALLFIASVTCFRPQNKHIQAFPGFVYHWINSSVVVQIEQLIPWPRIIPIRFLHCPGNGITIPSVDKTLLRSRDRREVMQM